MMKLHPLNLIFFGLFICSIGLNICMWNSNTRLVYQIQKLEAGPAKGLFLQPQIPKPNVTDEELNELMKEILRKMARERVV